MDRNQAPVRREPGMNSDGKIHGYPRISLKLSGCGRIFSYLTGKTADNFDDIFFDGRITVDFKINNCGLGWTRILFQTEIRRTKNLAALHFCNSNSKLIFVEGISHQLINSERRKPTLSNSTGGVECVPTLCAQPGLDALLSHVSRRCQLWTISFQTNWHRSIWFLSRSFVLLTKAR